MNTIAKRISFGILKGACAAALLLAASLAFGFAAYAAEADEAVVKRVTSDRVNFRKGPGTDEEVIRVLKAGTVVEVAYVTAEDWGRVEYDGVRGYIKAEYLITEEEWEALPKSLLELLTWAEAKRIVPIGADMQVIDVYTGLTYNIRSFSNGNHADVEPITKEDTAIMKSTYGGAWSWDTRPVWVLVNGRVLAASINGMPHGGGVNGGNGMNGQVCLHFKGSTTHNGNRSHEREHQASVAAAWAAGQY